MRTIDDILRTHQTSGPECLIPVLQEIQEEQGYLSREAMGDVAQALNIPVCKVFGVATFYNQFRFAPVGKNLIEVCRGTACHVKGSAPLVDHLRRRLQLDEDGNSRDGKFTLFTLACLGACSIAPVMRLNGEFHGHLTPERLETLLREIES